MNKREKTLVIIVLVVGGGAGLVRFVLPAVREYVFAVGEENERLTNERDDLLDELDTIVESRQVYREMVERTGGTDVIEVQNAVKANLEAMIRTARFTKPALSPRKPTDYRAPGVRKKSGIQRVTFGFKADGSLKSMIDFLESFYELPYISQVTELKLSPAARSRGRNKKTDTVRMTATIETLILPLVPVGEVNPELLSQPPVHVKHGGRRYAMIAERDPFNEYVKPKPPPIKPKPRVVAMNPDPPPPPPPPPKPVGDRDRTRKFVRMVMHYGDKANAIGEVYVYNSKDESKEYIRVGDQLDGGEVMLVHPLGPVTHRKNGDRLFYPVGKLLSESIKFEETGEVQDVYPEVAYVYAAKVKTVDPPSEEESAVQKDASGEKPGDTPEPGAGDSDMLKGAPPGGKKADTAKGKQTLGKRANPIPKAAATGSKPAADTKKSDKKSADR